MGGNAGNADPVNPRAKSIRVKSVTPVPRVFRFYVPCFRFHPREWRHNGGDEMDQRVANEYTAASHEMEFTQVLIAAVQDGKSLSRSQLNGEE